MFGRKKKKKAEDDVQEHPFRPMVVEVEMGEPPKKNVLEECVEILDGSHKDFLKADKWLDENWDKVRDALRGNTLRSGNSFLLSVGKHSDVEAPEALKFAITAQLQKRLESMGFKETKVRADHRSHIHIRVR